jgi:hypothetical protein
LIVWTANDALSCKHPQVKPLDFELLNGADCPLLSPRSDRKNNFSISSDEDDEFVPRPIPLQHTRSVISRLSRKSARRVNRCISLPVSSGMTTVELDNPQHDFKRKCIKLANLDESLPQSKEGIRRQAGSHNPTLSGLYNPSNSTAHGEKDLMAVDLNDKLRSLQKMTGYSKPILSESPVQLKKAITLAHRHGFMFQDSIRNSLKGGKGGVKSSSVFDISSSKLPLSYHYKLPGWGERSLSMHIYSTDNGTENMLERGQCKDHQLVISRSAMYPEKSSVFEQRTTVDCVISSA